MEYKARQTGKKDDIFILSSLYDRYSSFTKAFTYSFSRLPDQAIQIPVKLYSYLHELRVTNLYDLSDILC